jgi:CubicO group peptidase (beta-lactamase class C family)
VGEGFRIIAPSRIGYLRIPLPQDASPAAQADAYACLLDALNISKVAVVGVSAEAGGKELDLREETLRQLMAPPVAPLHGFRDGALKVDVRFSLGFTKPDPKNPFGHPGSFGFPGFGGSFGFADPEAKIGYGYAYNYSSYDGKSHNKSSIYLSNDYINK